MKTLGTFLILLLSVTPILGQGVVHTCDFEPTTEKYCDKYTDRNYYYLENVKVMEDGVELVKQQATVYFMFTSDYPFGDAGQVIFEFHEVMDAVTGDYKYLESRFVEVQPDWNTSWVKYTFDTKGLFALRVFIGDKWVAGYSISIWERE